MTRAILCFSNLSHHELEYLRAQARKKNLMFVGVISHPSSEAKARSVLEPEYYLSWGVESASSNWSLAFDHMLFEKCLGNRITEALGLTEREQPYSTGSIGAYNRLAADFSRALHLLKSTDPEVILFLKEPENSVEYVLYRLARTLSIPVLMNRQAGFLSWISCVSQDIDEPILLADLTVADSTVQLGPASALPNKVSARTEPYLKALSRVDGKDLHSYMRNKNFSLLVLTGLYLKRFFLRSLGQRKLLHPPAGLLYQLALRKQYRKNVAIKNISEVRCLKQRFKILFVPLHYQPELTTMPLGGIFNNQTLMLKTLSDSLPDDWVILVKEHPAVLSSRSRVNPNFRDKSFYERITSFRGAQLIALEVPNNVLYEECDAVATVTGTSGFEALLRGVPILLFGNAFYRNIKGSFKVNNPDDIEAAISEIEQGVPITDKDIYDFIKNLESVSLRAPQGKMLSERTQKRILHIDSLMRAISITSY